MKDVVSPAHYTRLQPQPIDVIEAWKLGFDLGNVVKYVARAGHKPGVDALIDLAKAKRYLEHAIDALGCRCADAPVVELAADAHRVDCRARRPDEVRVTGDDVARMREGERR